MASFSYALERVKTGFRITRRDWNARGQYVVYQPGYPDGIGINANTAEATGIPEGTVKRFRPYLMLHTAQGDFVPWAPTVSDVLAGDWDDSRAGDCSGVKEPEPDLPSATVTCSNVTVNLHTEGKFALTDLQTRELTELIQARLLQHAKRGHRGPGFRGPGIGT
jgi:hypothetical protein